jgi:hypothetical protein
MTTILPGQRFISKIAACGAGPEFNNITCPVAVLFPCQSTVTVPPELPLFTRQNEPKFIACVEWTVTVREGNPGCEYDEKTKRNRAGKTNDSVLLPLV